MFGILKSIFGNESTSTGGLAEIREMSWRQFEWVVREGFRRRGYSFAEHAQLEIGAPVDLVFLKDRERVFVACTQWKTTKIGAKPVRDLFGAMTAHEATAGVFIAAGTFSDEARRIANEMHIDLIDASTIEQLLLDARRPEPFMDPTDWRRQTSFRKQGAEPLCPMCGGGMIKRTYAGGPQQGKHFWSCLQQPQCRGTRDA